MSAGKIKRKDKPVLPIEPTAKPRGDDIAKVALACVALTQTCLLSPAAVISSLRCALDIYLMNVSGKGYDDSAAAECELLGTKLAESMVETGIVKNPAQQPVIEQVSTGLVGPDGKPLATSAQTLASTLQAIRERGTEPGSDSP